ncbi:MAG: lipopolysaccharide biosynthesis protein [Flavobacteriaceae bacterium]|nr:MAG: lipopolysaccharide biosynthesis protein [Flavobacteriaceae bacterium]
MNKITLVHTHIHKRRTGITRSIENVLPYFKSPFKPLIYGNRVEWPLISFGQIFKMALKKTYFVMHCHRNNEIYLALFLKLIGGNFKLVSSRHAETTPSKLTAFLLGKSAVVVALTQRMADALPMDAIVVGHGVDVEKFKPNTHLFKEVTQANIISCAGRVRQAKGHHTLVSALAPELAKNPTWALAIIGKVDNEKFVASLKEIIAKYKVEKQVYFFDERPDIIEIYQASHTVVAPSFSEGFSLVCAEAMACGCNTIATKNVGIHSKLIKHGVSGYTFEAGNHSELQEIVSGIMSSKIPHLGVEARKTICDHWSAQKEASELAAVYLN